MATLGDIAKKVGVSSPTVSVVLNRKAQEKRISKDLQNRILKAARELNYRPNQIARSLILKKTRTLGLIMSGLGVMGPFYSEFIEGVEGQAKKNDHHVLISYSHNSFEREEEDINLMLERKVDGLIILPIQGRTDLRVYQDLQDKKVPFVLVDVPIADFQGNFVGTDNAGGAYSGVDHLIRLGHQRIGFISKASKSLSYRERLEGYTKALRANDIPLDEDLITMKAPSETAVREIVRTFLRVKGRPTALFAVSGSCVVEVYAAIKEEGLTMPQDIALVAFTGMRVDVPPLSVTEFSKLTTVQQSGPQLGSKAVDIVLQQIDDGCDGVQRVMLKPRLVVRGSCGAQQEGLDTIEQNHNVT